jgi:hypothetical protein
VLRVAQTKPDRVIVPDGAGDDSRLIYEEDLVYPSAEKDISTTNPAT